MTPLTHLNNDQRKRHFLFWSIIVAYLNFDSPVPGSWAAKIIGGGIESLNYIIVFYSISLFIFPKFWGKRRIYLLFIFVLACYCLFSLVTYFNYLRVIPSIGGYSWHQKYPVSDLLLHNIYYFIILCSAGAASFYYRNGIYQFTLQAQKEKLLLVKELNFLKNQFNSHITFNFLNYCYSKIHQKHTETAESVALFSEILRYNLQTKSEIRVLLSNEIENIENFINLQSLLNTNVHTQFSYETEIENFLIFPRILISLIENVFKIEKNNDSKSQILVNLEVPNDTLIFTIKKKINTGKELTSILSDLENVTTLLNLYYNNNYHLIKEEIDGFCVIQLCIMKLEVTSENEFNNALYQNRPTGTSSKKIGNEPTLDQKKLISRSLMRLNKNQIQKHVLAWIFIIIYHSITSVMPGTWTAKIIGTILYNVNFIFVFYGIGLYVFPKYWEGKRLLLMINISFILVIYWINSYLIFKAIIPFLKGFTDIQELPLYDFFKERFYFFILSSSAGAASFYSRYGLLKVKKKADKEKMLLAKELSFLKDRFNSQLTFDFLNYCYNNVCKFSSDTAESIKLFSDMLRYTLQTKSEEKVALNNEIIYIKDFISLQKLLSAKVYVELLYEGDLNNKFVLPRILITFVENAFKHGLNNDPECPIVINLIVASDRLVFTVKNKINPNKTAQSSNTGLENVNQILELYYTNNYELKKEEKDGFFNVKLRLGL